MNLHLPLGSLFQLQYQWVSIVFLVASVAQEVENNYSSHVESVLVVPSGFVFSFFTMF